MALSIFTGRGAPRGNGSSEGMPALPKFTQAAQGQPAAQEEARVCTGAQIPGRPRKQGLRAGGGNPAGSAGTSWRGEQAGACGPRRGGTRGPGPGRLQDAGTEGEMKGRPHRGRRECGACGARSHDPGSGPRAGRPGRAVGEHGGAPPAAERGPGGAAGAAPEAVTCAGTCGASDQRSESPPAGTQRPGGQRRAVAAGRRGRRLRAGRGPGAGGAGPSESPERRVRAFAPLAPSTSGPGGGGGGGWCPGADELPNPPPGGPGEQPRPRTRPAGSRLPPARSSRSARPSGGPRGAGLWPGGGCARRTRRVPGINSSVRSGPARGLYLVGPPTQGTGEHVCPRAVLSLISFPARPPP